MKVSSYTGKAVFDANSAGFIKVAPKPKAPENKPSKERILANYSKAIESGDTFMQGVWLEAYEALEAMEG